MAIIILFFVFVLLGSIGQNLFYEFKVIVFNVEPRKKRKNLISVDGN